MLARSPALIPMSSFILLSRTWGTSAHLLQFENAVELAFVKSAAILIIDEIENESVCVAVRTRAFVFA